METRQGALRITAQRFEESAQLVCVRRGCIDFFEAWGSAPNDVIRFEALARTGPVADAALLNLDFNRSLSSHFACRYDCAPSRDVKNGF